MSLYEILEYYLLILVSVINWFHFKYFISKDLFQGIKGMKVQWK